MSAEATKEQESNSLKDNIVDARSFKKNKKIKVDNLTDDIIKSLVLLHKKTDDGLKELAEMCLQEKDGK